MRVISGSRKGQRLRGSGRTRIRPTSEKVRTAIFNILPFDFSEAEVLDLFAGTGAMGIEALSRGARRAVFVDASFEALKLIQRNLKDLRFLDQGRVMKKKATAALKLLDADNERFDLVFIDPPYQGREALQVMELLAGLMVLAPAGVVVLEHDPRLALSGAYGSLVRSDVREYGGSAVSFYRRKEPT